MNAQELLKDLVKASGSKYASIVKNGTMGDIIDYIDTGSYILNSQFSGDMFKGIPTNRTIGIAGWESTGKTYFVTSIAKNFLKKYEEGIVIFADTENSVNKAFFEKRKMDISRIIILYPETVEDFRTQGVNIVNKLNEKKRGEVKALMILDSLTQLPDSEEVEKAEKGSNKKAMKKSQIIKSAFRVLNLKLMKHQIPLLITSHVYENMDGNPYTLPTIAGGGGLKFAASIIAYLSKSKVKDKEKNVIGSWISCIITKSRICKEFTKTKSLLHNMKGLHPYSQLDDIAVEIGIWKKEKRGSKGTWIIGDGFECKEREIMIHPKKYFTDDIMNKINKYLKEKHSFGDDLGVNDWIEDENNKNEIEHK